MTLQFGIPLTLLGAFLQSAVIAPYWPLEGKPDIVPVIVLLWAALDDNDEGLAWAFIGGLFIDIFSGMPFGISSILLVGIALVLGFFEVGTHGANPIFLAIAMGASLLVYHIGHMILLMVFDGQVIYWRYAILSIALPSILFDVILVLPLARLFEMLHDRTHTRGVGI